MRPTYSDEHCTTCGMVIEDFESDHGDEGFCSADCLNDYNIWKEAYRAWDSGPDRLDGLPAPTYALPVVRPMFELLSDELGARDPAGWSRRIYKDTDYGAYLHVIDHTHILIGSIVEGTDATPIPETLAWPFNSNQLWAAVQTIEDECERIWMETHGCDTCEARLGEEGPVDPDCPDCGGAGVVI